MCWEEVRPLLCSHLPQPLAPSYFVLRGWPGYSSSGPGRLGGFLVVTVTALGCVLRPTGLSSYVSFSPAQGSVGPSASLPLWSWPLPSSPHSPGPGLCCPPVLPGSFQGVDCAAGAAAPQLSHTWLGSLLGPFRDEASPTDWSTSPDAGCDGFHSPPPTTPGREAAA